MIRHCQRSSVRAAMGAVLLVAGLILATVAAGVAPESRPALAVQEGPRLASLEIAVWPEFDRRAAALVIMQGRLAEDVELPAEVTVSVPASSGGPAAVATAPSETDPLLNIDYELATVEDSLRVTFTTQDPYFQVEFYDPLAIDADDRSYTYVWPGDLAVDGLTMEVQEPVGVSGLTIGPDLGTGTRGPDGLLYHSAEMGPLEAGKALTLNVNYVKADPRTSVEILGLNVAEETSDGGIPTWAIVLIAAAAASVVIGGAAAYWQMQRGRVPVSAGPAPGRRRGARGAARPVASPDSQTFCTQCGEPLRQGDQFCSRCGAASRGG